MPAASKPLSEIGSKDQRRNSPSYNQATRKMIVSRESSPYTENSSPPSFLKPTSSPRDFWSKSRDSSNVSATMSPSRMNFHDNNNTENETPPDHQRPISPSPRRSSIEKLKQASRVRNSNIFALESKDAYDPSTLPVVERPSANRPLAQGFVNNSFARFDSLRKENKNPYRSPERLAAHKRTESVTNVDFSAFSPTKSAPNVPLPPSPEKAGWSPTPTSPTKSSLARTSQFGISPFDAFDPENGTWSPDEERVPTPRAANRHAKSVTFHNDPPVINEYEQPTPEPSVAGTASDREGSWDSDDFYDEDISFDRGSSADADGMGARDDSFDADLENADKTPVVLPEDWSRMSPEEARNELADQEDDVFDEEGDAEPTERATFIAPQQQQSDRVASDGSDHRPLPPLPAFMQRDRRGSDPLSSAAERAAHATSRSLPSPPKRASCSKEEILKMRTGTSGLTLQDRVQLMGSPQDDRPSSKSSSNATETEQAHTEELTITNLDTGEKIVAETVVREEEIEVEEGDSFFDHSIFQDAPPRISRESILRKVRNAKYDFEDFEDDEDEEDESTVFHEANSSPARPTIAELARMDPDQPIPSREHSRETSDTFDAALTAATYVARHEEEVEVEVKIKQEPRDDDGDDDENTIALDSIPAAVATELVAQSPLRSPSRMEDYYDRQSSVLRHNVNVDGEEADEEDEENARDSESRYSSEGPDAESTMLRTTREETVEYQDGSKETLHQAMQLLTVEDYSTYTPTTPYYDEEAAAEPTKAKQGAAGSFMSLPPAYLSTDEDYDFGMKEYITPSPPAAVSNGSSGNSMQKLEETKMPAFLPPMGIEHGASMGPALEQSSQESRSFAFEEERQSPPYDNDDAGPKDIISPPGTPESVIRHDSEGVVSPIEEDHTGLQQQEEGEKEEDDRRESDPGIPERIASIKTGGKLKARPSATPADFEMMAEQRRLVSSEHPVPPIPQAFQAEFVDDANAGSSSERPGSSQSAASSHSHSHASVEKTKSFRERRKSRKSGGRMDLDIELGLDTSTFSLHDDNGGLGLDREFDRVIEGQKKGYLMRQNTKVVVASNRNVSGESNDTAKSSSTIVKDKENNAPPMSPTFDAARPTSAGAAKRKGDSPRKASEEQFMKTEPWNGKTRRKSLRVASAQKHAYRSEPAPPLPGQESVALGVVDEDYAAGTSNLDDEIGEGVERGRLFVKVVGVKALDLPMPRNERVNFQLTLDNGLHCVTTTSLELGKSAPIGQEFELVVLDDLEFQLTLTTQLPQPPRSSNPTPAPSSSPTKSLKSQKSTAFSRFLSSPKKRAEKERLEREAAETETRRQQEEQTRKRASLTPGAWDLLHELVNASDGSFARAYVNLKSHESACFGRPVTVDVPCYNEWALEQDTQVVNSVRSKRGHHANSGPIRKPPYVVGQLELQLLYVPKPRGAVEEDMPKSMSGAVREMNRASEVKEVVYEGHLSQQGGDCVHWRRRFFGLQGAKLTAYHEHTHQKRAVINLSKASRLVDDKSMLMADPSPSKSSKGGRRKSAFAEEDEGYQYVEEGFRIRFANGETIDFYADSREHKDQWMVVLSQVIGKPDTSTKTNTWTDLVLARERAEGKVSSSSPGKGGGGTDVRDFTKPPPPPPAMPRQNSSHRKPVGQQQQPRPSSKSAPNSPMKGGQVAARSGAMSPPPLATANPSRPKTPPMKPRTGHRSRDAVKSMIF